MGAENRKESHGADEDHVARFDVWLRSRDCSVTQLAQSSPTLLVSHLVLYLRQKYNNKELSPSGAIYSVAAVRRFMLLAASLGADLGSIQDLLKPAWRTVRGWRVAVPPEFRAPAPLELVAAIALFAWVHGQFNFSIMFSRFSQNLKHSIRFVRNRGL